MEEMLTNSIIRPTYNSFSSLVLLVKKKDGSWRFFIDYKQLNTTTINNKFPILLVEDLLDMLYSAKYFTKLDLQSQIRMKAREEHKMIFKTY